MSEFDFDPNAIDGYEGSGGLLTPGASIAVFTSYEVKASKLGSGTYWEAIAQFLDGPDKGRQWTVRITKTNSNQQAVEIGRKQIAQICASLGGIKPQSFGEFLNKPIKMTVRNKKDKQDNMQSNIVKFESVSGTTTQPTTHQQTVNQPQHSPSTPPWRK